MGYLSILGCMLDKLSPFKTDESGERAVSPVIGVILMVAITVILAAVIASFVLGLGDTDDPAPNLVFEDQYDSGEFEIGITSGDSDADASLLELSGDNITATWDEVNGDGLGAGESAVLNVSDSAEDDDVAHGDEIQLIWDGDDILTTVTVPEEE